MHSLLPVGLTPPRRWPAKPWPALARLSWRVRDSYLARFERVDRIDLQGVEHLRDALAAGRGVLLAPNHARYADPVVLTALAEAVGRPFLTVTAWQVFGTRPAPARWLFQRLGCLSIDREGNDLPAFREAVAAVAAGPFPLLVFPEGEIYRTNDRVTPFHDGPAAIALAAQRRRPVSLLPVAIQYRLTDDPTPELAALAGRLEAALFWRPQPDWPLPRRVERIAQGALALKEIEHLGETRTGPLGDRVAGLLDAVLRPLPGDAPAASPPDRITAVRRAALARGDRQSLAAAELAVQLFAYPAGYLGDSPTLDRLNETLSKLEEDVLGVALSRGRGRQRATVRVGEPVPLPAGKAKDAATAVTREMEARVQGMLDEMGGHTIPSGEGPR